MGQVGVPGEDGDARVEVEAPDRVEGGDAAVAVTPLSRWTGKSENGFETELPSERNEVTEQNCLKMCHPIQNNNNNNNRHHILQVLTTTKNS